ncbi:MAG: transcriptional regulator/antitoxin, MazE [Candidatus Hydrogenedentes bacterium]|nr:transcriptional regulator/antitoxin, MazE [Candidatus Hydrogenedentota bacterium]
MVTRIQKWGNSQGLRLTRDILESASIEIGEEVEVSTRQGVIEIRVARRIRGKYDIEELVSRIPRHAKRGEIEWGEPRGKETW